MVFPRYIKDILKINMFLWSTHLHIEGIYIYTYIYIYISNKKQRYVHGISKDILKVYDMVYQIQKYVKRNTKRY